jgi:hypothetical protein
LEPAEELMGAMEKAKTEQPKRQRRLKGPCLPGQMTVLQFPDRPAAVPLDEWEQYQQLASELEEAECLVRNIRQRLRTVKQQLARRIKYQHSSSPDQSLERLAAASPVTDLLQ